MKHTHLFLALSTVSLLVLGAACGRSETPNTSKTNVVTNTTINQNANSDVNSSNTNASVPVTSNGSLTITQPAANASVTSPAEVAGASEAAKVTVRVKNASDREVLAVPVTVRNGAYHVNLAFEFINTTSGTIEVVELNADGTDGKTVSVPVTFASSAADSNTNASSDTTNANTNSSSY